ncbi:MAG: 50S ribosomal protein L10 [candidate division WOR-3 bacterium]|nr:50S ribosomal protein L10 [candidate division WOR-3 bacterium]MCX7837429.1 50S ribosomal protein L10 [candidate division WOR-3 bacterium]MDW8114584.1 50S ribosomal protein L10 [candidate division WOR-3 bacterium]
MVKEEKINKVKSLKEILKNAKGLYFVDFTNITANELTRIRMRFQEEKIRMIVVKNNLCELALQELNFPKEIEKFLIGPTALVISEEEPTKAAKLIKESKLLKFKGSIVEEKIFYDKDFDFLASIPSKKELYSQVLNHLLSPVLEFILILENNFRELIFILENLKNKKTEGG